MSEAAHRSVGYAHCNGCKEHDDSGIPISQLDPYSDEALVQGWIVACGTPYASYCSANGMLSKNHGVSLMQPYYFRFVRRQDDIRVGYFDYRPRNAQEAVV